MDRNINYLCLFCGLLLLGSGFYFSAFRVPGTIYLRSPRRCDRRGLYETNLTYQATCPTNRTASRTYYRRRVRRSLFDGRADDPLYGVPRRRQSTTSQFNTPTRRSPRTQTKSQSPTSKHVQPSNLKRRNPQPTKLKRQKPPRRIRRTRQQQRRSLSNRGVFSTPRRRRSSVRSFRGGGPGAGK